MHDPGEVRHEPGRGQADPAALAATGDRHPAGVDRRVGPDRLHRAHRVGEDPPVEVRRRIQDALGHEARLRRGPVAVRVGRLADEPARPLTARVHHQVRVARDRPEDPFVGQAAAAAVAAELHDARQRSRARRRAGGASPGSASRRSRET